MYYFSPSLSLSLPLSPSLSLSLPLSPRHTYHRVARMMDKYDSKEGPEDQAFRYPWHRTLVLYCLQPLNIVDLLSIVPFYHDAVTGRGTSLAIFRVVRLARIVRLVKSGKGRFQRELRVLTLTLKHSAPMCAFLFVFTAVLMLIFGAVAFILEGGAFRVMAGFPDGVYVRTDLYGEHLEQTPFLSVLHGVYYAVVTATTVGYGDLYPTTVGGRVWGCMCTVFGIATLALPLSVIGTHFSKNYEKIFPVGEFNGAGSLKIIKDDEGDNQQGEDGDEDGDGDGDEDEGVDARGRGVTATVSSDPEGGAGADTGAGSDGAARCGYASNAGCTAAAASATTNASANASATNTTAAAADNTNINADTDTAAAATDVLRARACLGELEHTVSLLAAAAASARAELARLEASLRARAAALAPAPAPAPSRPAAGTMEIDNIYQ
jgi:hypothetical protein